MDEFISQVLNKKATIGVENFIKAYGKLPVMASEDYMLNNEMLMSGKDVILINPKTSWGKFFEGQIPKVSDLLNDFEKSESDLIYAPKSLEKESKENILEPRVEVVQKNNDYRIPQDLLVLPNNLQPIVYPTKLQLERILQDTSADDYRLNIQMPQKVYYMRGCRGPYYFRKAA